MSDARGDHLAFRPRAFNIDPHEESLGIAVAGGLGLDLELVGEQRAQFVGVHNVTVMGNCERAAAHEVRGSRVLQDDTIITSFTPHMHLRGKDMTYTAKYPDGRTEVLLSVPKYDFNWQITYQLKEAKRMPKGTEIEVVAHFDNSTQNKFNPDPTKDVRWGDQTFEEMMIGFWGTVAERPRQ